MKWVWIVWEQDEPVIVGPFDSRNSALVWRERSPWPLETRELTRLHAPDEYDAQAPKE